MDVGVLRSAKVVLLTAALTVTALLPATAGTAPDDHCTRQDRIRVPGAEEQRTSCLDDLTTAGTLITGHTVRADWAGLTSAGTVNPTGVPGIQVDGYFPDSAPAGATPNPNNGWAHDSQFVIRFPDDWNGGLVVSGAPGVRRQYANDAAISDFVLAQRYAFAATDKGNGGATFYRDGTRPGDAILEWHLRVTQLTVAAKAAALQRYGRLPERTYAAGLSNGGYLVRWQLEKVPWLYDGGIDWEGTLFRAEGPNLFTYLPTALREYPRYAAGEPGAREAIVAAGFDPGSEFLWPFHHQVYWDLTQRIYREELDPAWDGGLEAGIPFCASGTPACDADYDYAGRPWSVKAAVAKVQNTGRIGKPLLTVHGDLDALLPYPTDSAVYADLVAGAGRGHLHRTYLVEDGTHVDGLADLHPDRLRPLLPCFRDAFGHLEAWVEAGAAPPPSGFVARPATGDVVNACSLGS